MTRQNVLTFILLLMYIPLDYERDTLKDHLMEELDYELLPKAAWEKFILWYGLTLGSKPICRLDFLSIQTKLISYICTYLFFIHRYVVQYGTYVKHLKVEVYLFDLKLCLHPFINEIQQFSFSKGDTISQSFYISLCLLSTYSSFN